MDCRSVENATRSTEEWGASWRLTRMNAKLEIHRKFSFLAWVRQVHVWIGPAGHHGPIVLICGLVGFAAGIVRLAALIQGIFDLHRMSKGEMDPAGRTLTIIGMILGGLGFLLNVGLIVTILVLHISLF
jgi:hypothetical protein